MSPLICITQLRERRLFYLTVVGQVINEEGILELDKSPFDNHLLIIPPGKYHQ